MITLFNIYLQGKPCQIFAAPFDLRLPDAAESDDEVTNVLQPDLLIVCDKSKLKGTGYYGAPSLIIEIASPAKVHIFPDLSIELKSVFVY